ncbi:MAG: UDP-N-acetylmuramoyl-L-alanyl-D-glutamate--2,6-diaminopimelate ligase [Planctomycetaceae bacterium]
MVGVTGTNGKTTTTWLVHSILKKSGRKSGLLGTVEYCDGEHREPAPLTTPDSKSFSRWLCRMRDRGVVSAAVELSSHALHQCRVAGAELRVAVVTNLTQDHFDYHGDFASYRNSKLRIFEQLQAGGVAILNADDPQVVSMAAEIGDRHPVVTYGLDSQADCTAAIVHESLSGSQIELNLMGERIAVQTSLVGRHNVSNCLAAAAAARAVGLSPDEIAIGLGALDTVPGRLERIDAGQPFSVFVDYAHTDDALRRCIRCLKRMADGRVICVFGAGGDRDRTKRPLLGKAASEADVAIVTSDNPRTESPGQIIDDILSGISTSVLKIVEEDRARAIHRAIDMARSDDCVLIAGKGHERFQILGTKRVSFDDREIAKTALRNLKQPVGISSDRISA